MGGKAPPSPEGIFGAHTETPNPEPVNLKPQNHKSPDLKLLHLVSPSPSKLGQVPEYGKPFAFEVWGFQHRRIGHLTLQRPEDASDCHVQRGPIITNGQHSFGSICQVDLVWSGNPGPNPT